MKILADCPDSATPTLALPPAWGRGGWGGFSYQDAEKPVFAQAAQKGPDARGRAM